MYNYVMLIGVLESVETQKTTIEELNVKANFVIAVQRPFKNGDGEYETDRFKGVVYGDILSFFLKEEMIGKKIGLKGRLAIKDNNQIIVGEKVISVETSVELK